MEIAMKREKYQEELKDKRERNKKQRKLGKQMLKVSNN
jgi:hypothetical protein